MLGYLTAEVVRALFVLDALTIAGVLVFALTGSLAFAIGAFRAQARRAPLPGVAQPGARTTLSPALWLYARAIRRGDARKRN